jgi:iron(III) transport system permease protein
LTRLLAFVLCLTVALLGALPACWVLFDGVLDPQGALRALSDLTLWSRLTQSLALASASAVLMLAVAIPLAWVLIRSDLPLRSLLLALAAFPLFIPPLVHVLAWFGWLGWSGPGAIIAINAIGYMPLALLLAATAFERIPGHLLDAVRLDASLPRAILWEWRRALPLALAGAGLAMLLMLSDYATADFLSSVGPKITTWGDSLCAAYLSSSRGVLAGATLPGVVLGLGLLWLLAYRRGDPALAVDTDFSLARPVPLGRARWPVLGCVLGIVAAGTFAPVILLAWQTGSWATFRAQLSAAGPAVILSLWTSAAAALLMLALSIGLSLVRGATHAKRAIDALAFLPLAVPAIAFGIGLVRVWNRPLLDAVYLSPAVVIAAMTGRYLAVMFIPVDGAMRRIDPSLHDAARLEGAGWWRRFASIVLPIAAPAFVSAFCVAMCFSLRELDSFIMLAAGQESLTFKLYASVVFASRAELASLALILTLVTYVPFLVYVAAGRRWLRML